MALDFYKVIRGRLLVAGYSPDGDSIRFAPDDPDAFEDLHNAHRVNPSRKDGSVQLRLEGMDAPETHYGKFRQPLGDVARTRFLEDFAGFSGIAFDGNQRVTAATPATRDAVILSRAADVNGRPIAYLLAGSTFSAKDGEDVQLGTRLLADTVNHRMVAAGHAYPLAYSSTPASHRRALREAAQAARGRGLGLWPRDETDQFRLVDQSSIGEAGQLIFPKFFRRASDFLREANEARPDHDLRDWLLENGRENDELFIESAGGRGRRVQLRLSDVLDVRNATVSLQADLTELVFIEK